MVCNGRVYEYCELCKKTHANRIIDIKKTKQQELQKVKQILDEREAELEKKIKMINTQFTKIKEGVRRLTYDEILCGHLEDEKAKKRFYIERIQELQEIRERINEVK